MSVDMQLQMRRNVEQMHNTASELDGWLGEIGKRDATLRGKADPTGSRSAATGDETDEEEEAREIEAAKEELRQLAAAQEVETKALSSAGDAPAKKKKAPLTHAQKYGQWDRYDVDGIVNAMEEKEADQERLRKEVVRLENQRAQHKARKAAAAATAAAEALRLQGNEAFSAARYEEAVGLYTDALNHAPRSAPLYANRALSLLKLHAYAEAEEDCEAALLLEPQHVKARLRRAQARHALTNYEGALEDLEEALLVEPRNSAARALMAECRQLKRLTTPKPAAPMIAVEVEQVEYDPDNDDDAFVLALTDCEPAAEPAAKPTEAQPRAAAVPASTVAATATANATAIGAGGGSEREAAGGADGAGIGAARGGGAIGAAEGGAARTVQKVAPTAESFALPSTLSEMERGWRSLRGAPEQWAAWVGRIEPATMKSLFKTTLPADLFTAILKAVDMHLSLSDPARTLAIMQALTCAGRFTILVMCMDKADRQAIDAINIRLIEAQGRGEIEAGEDLAELRKLYE